MTLEVTLPAAWYGDPDVHERERQAIFRRDGAVWLFRVPILALDGSAERDLDAGVYGTGVLSPRHEAGVATVQRLVRAALGEPGR